MNCGRSISRVLIAPIDAAEGNVGGGEIASGKERFAAEPAVGDFEGLGGGFRGALDESRIATVLFPADRVHEQRPDRRLGGAHRPVHPLVGQRHRLLTARLNGLAAIAAGDMADDRLGFEKHDRAVADHRHQTHRVELEEGLVVQPSERAADGMPLKLDPGLSRGPQYFDNIERIPPTPKRDHACLRG